MKNCILVFLFILISVFTFNQSFCGENFEDEIEESYFSDIESIDELKWVLTIQSSYILIEGLLVYSLSKEFFDYLKGRGIIVGDHLVTKPLFQNYLFREALHVYKERRTQLIKLYDSIYYHQDRYAKAKSLWSEIEKLDLSKKTDNIRYLALRKELDRLKQLTPFNIKKQSEILRATRLQLEKDKNMLKFFSKERNINKYFKGFLSLIIAIEIACRVNLLSNNKNPELLPLPSKSIDLAKMYLKEKTKFFRNEYADIKFEEGSDFKEDFEEEN